MEEVLESSETGPVASPLDVAGDPPAEKDPVEFKPDEVDATNGLETGRRPDRGKEGGKSDKVVGGGNPEP